MVCPSCTSPPSGKEKDPIRTHVPCNCRGNATPSHDNSPFQRRLTPRNIKKRDYVKVAKGVSQSPERESSLPHTKKESGELPIMAKNSQRIILASLGDGLPTFDKKDFSQTEKPYTKLQRKSILSESRNSKKRKSIDKEPTKDEDSRQTLADLESSSEKLSQTTNLEHPSKVMLLNNNSKLTSSEKVINNLEISRPLKSQAQAFDETPFKKKVRSVSRLESEPTLPDQISENSFNDKNKSSLQNLQLSKIKPMECNMNSRISTKSPKKLSKITKKDEPLKSPPPSLAKSDLTTNAKKTSNLPFMEISSTPNKSAKEDKRVLESPNILAKITPLNERSLANSKEASERRSGCLINNESLTVPVSNQPLEDNFSKDADTSSCVSNDSSIEDESQSHKKALKNVSISNLKSPEGKKVKKKVSLSDKVEYLPVDYESPVKMPPKKIIKLSHKDPRQAGLPLDVNGSIAEGQLHRYLSDGFEEEFILGKRNDQKRPVNVSSPNKSDSGPRTKRKYTKRKKKKMENSLLESPKRPVPKRKRGRSRGKKAHPREDSPWESDRENESIQLRLSKSPSKLVRKSPSTKAGPKPKRRKTPVSKKQSSPKKKLSKAPNQPKSKRGRKKKIPDSDVEYSLVKEKKARRRKRYKGGRSRDDFNQDEGLEKSMQPKEPLSINRKRYSVVGYWYIASGYLNDIINLLDNFESIPGWRFSNFASCWQNKKFSLVYRGRQTFKELLEFSEEVALLTKRFLRPPHSTKRRIGALYTLYGLYFKHPVGHFFNLRFDLQEYKDLLELIQPFRSNPENPDPAFILRKLEVDGALRYCANSTELCYDFHNDEREYVDLEYGKQRLAKSSAVDVALPKIRLEADTELLKHYNISKAKISGAGEMPERSLSILAPEFTNEICHNLSQLKQEALESLAMSSLERLDPYMERHRAALEAFNSFQNGSGPTQTPESCKFQINPASHVRSIENFQLLQEKFEALPSSTGLEKPLLLINDTPARKKKKKEIPDETGFSLNLDSIAAPERGEETPLTTTNLNAYDCMPDVEEPSDIPKPIPKRSKSQRRTKAILNSRLFEPSQVLKMKNEGKRGYQPYAIPKTLDEDHFMTNEASGDHEISQDLSPNHATATSLLPSELPIVPASDASITSNTLLMKAVISSDKVIKVKKLKVKVSRRQWNEIQLDEKRLSKFKMTLMPLLIPKGEENQENWSLKDLSVLPESATKDETPSYITMFDNLNKMKEQRDDPYRTPSDSSDSASEYSSVHDSDSDPFPESDSDCGGGYIYVKSRKRKHRNGPRDYTFRNGMRDDSLITRQDGSVKMMMMPVKLGGQIKYIPVDHDKSNEQLKKKKKNENIKFHAWNDFSSDRPPIIIRGRKSSTKPYTIMCPSSKQNANHEASTKPSFKKDPKSVMTLPIPKVSSPPLQTQQQDDQEEEDEPPHNIKLSMSPLKTERTTIEDIQSDWQDEGLPNEMAAESDQGEDNVSDDFLPDDVDGHLEMEHDHDFNLKYIPSPEQSPVNSLKSSPDKESKYLTSTVEAWDVANNSDTLNVLTTPTFMNSDTPIPSTSIPTQGSSEFEVIDAIKNKPSPVNMLKDFSSNTSIVRDLPPNTDEPEASEENRPCYGNLPTINLNEGPVGKPLFYMLKDSDGNNVFVPLTTCPPINEREVDFLSPEMTPIKTELSPQMATTNLTLDQDSESDKRPNASLSNKSDRSLQEPSIISPIPSPISIVQPIAPSPSLKTNGRASCSFFFSSKFKSLKGLHSAVGEASGKPPIPPVKRPVVRFLRRGSLKGSKKVVELS